MTFKQFLLTTATTCVLFASSVHAQAEIKLRFGYETPRSDTQHITAQKWNDILKERTKGALSLRLFPDSTLGNAAAMISSVRSGIIDIEMSGSPNFSGLVPEMNVIDIPFIFKDEAHAYKILDGEVGDLLLKKLEDQGLKGLAFWDVGFRSITNSKHSIHTPEDVKGLKIRTNANPMYIEAFKQLGANPVPMSFSELYTALETRTVDAQEHPIGVVWSAKLYEVQKYLSMSKHAYTPLIVVMNKKKFDELSPEIQAILISSAKEMGQYQRQLNKENEVMIIAGLKKAGVEVIEDLDRSKFEAIIAQKGRDYFKERYGDELIKLIDTQE